ncbi:hypothetical protein L195_g045750 [Trifolium pratense]|uniref:Uncharacterized protein n=1 Tax=Trifolium pratense TaxID=57577 RepID=A0A2K3MFQ9_TRIPR|nr:hypothetical protein L195_g045750 [Trifolium pratense]
MQSANLGSSGSRSTSFIAHELIVVVVVKLSEEGAMDIHRHGYFQATLW